MSDQQPSTSLTSNNPPLLRVLAKRARKTMPVQIKTMTNHPVCLEQQIFFKEVMEAIMGNDEAPRKVGYQIRNKMFVSLLLGGPAYIGDG